MNIERHTFDVDKVCQTYYIERGEEVCDNGTLIWDTAVVYDWNGEFRYQCEHVRWRDTAGNVIDSAERWQFYWNATEKCGIIES